MYKILIPIQGDFVAPRFDCATEIVIALIKDCSLLEPPRTLIMERASEKELCQKIIGENISELVCGGIDEAHYDFLIWKKITVVDGVIGYWQIVLEKAISKEISAGEIVLPTVGERINL